MRVPKGLLLAVAATFTLASGEALAASEDEGLAGDFSTAWFVSPLPNALFEGAPVTFDAEIGVYQGADDGPLTSVEVFVNGETLGAQDCPDGCTFADITLDKGVHELSVIADTGYSTAILVYVDEEVPVDMTDTGTDGGGGGNGGGGCSVHAATPWPWALSALPLLMLVAGSRRRQSRQ
ncbi:Ig-like domain-containing protein [Enhygromyxa salina]|uniref:PEGA domain-containing protein n=1 Tax=Enhygromyxa salina TaxID=215803 RepID=A0A2S9YDG0_9BACT|nr:Ig-like domain-containing protein [Enhygromyxa salina]PRQ03144.1 hypothetical protein ENSA7_54150 [Enhygromyxa salina]